MRKLTLMLSCALLAARLGTTAAHAQGRWELGNPSMHIDLPGEPSRADVAWGEANTWRLTAQSWKAEGNGVVVEAARFYDTRRTPEQMVEAFEAKTGPAGTRERGEVSGRDYVVAQNDARLVAAIAPTPGVSGSPAWGLVITGNAGQARTIFNSIEMEREGPGKTAMRSLGPTKLIAELPVELAPALRSVSANQRRYEANWDRMSAEVTVQTGDPNMRWDTKKTISSFIDSARGRSNISGFKSEKTGIKFSKMSGDMATLTFKQGTRDYKIWYIAVSGGQEGYTIEFDIDPKRADHILTVARALETIRTTDIPAWGWKSYTMGGVTVDSPSAFKQTKQSDSVTEWESGAAAMPVTVREVVLTGGAMMDPDTAAAQGPQVMKLMPGMATATHTGTQRRIVDGLPARLVEYTWKNAGFTNRRSQLFIYGATRTWVVDAIAMDNYGDWLNRLFETVRVNVPETGAQRQRIGAMDTTFRYGTAPIEIVTPAPPAKEIKAIAQSIIQFPSGGLAAVVDQTMAEDGKVLEKQAYSFYESFSTPLKSPPPTESHAITIDGARGFHLRGKATAGGILKDTDLVMVARGKVVLVIFVLSDPNSIADRSTRDELLNTLRFRFV